MSTQNTHDPRTRLVREKYFSLRPKPLERWLWSQGVPASAERVFWVHWQEGLQRGDWCSQIPLKRVARECCLDLSTVTRSYQLLARLGCLRRTDPGRDPANPFSQATAITEVRIPRELLVELDRQPNRRSEPSPQTATPAPESLAEDALVGAPSEVPRPQDPFAGLRGRERVQALGQLLRSMSPAEEGRYHEALRLHHPHLEFDPQSRLTAAERGRVLQFLGCLAAPPVVAATRVDAAPAAKRPRKLSVFELARLKREIQTVSSIEDAPELLRQVVWAVEEGSLLRFGPLHAVHIALKKIREGAWTRPHRMPPNWARTLTAPLGTCRRA